MYPTDERVRGRVVNCGSSVGDAVDRRDRVIPRARTLDDLQERLSPRSLIGEASRAERKAGELLKEMEKAKGAVPRSRGRHRRGSVRCRVR